MYKQAADAVAASYGAMGGDPGSPGSHGGSPIKDLAQHKNFIDDWVSTRCILIPSTT